MSTNGQERREKKALKTIVKQRDDSCDHKVISISHQTEDEDKEHQKHLAVVITPMVLLFYRSTNKHRRTEAMERRSQSKYAKRGYA